MLRNNRHGGSAFRTSGCPARLRVNYRVAIEIDDGQRTACVSELIALR
jgi:hypothetical protein